MAESTRRLSLTLLLVLLVATRSHLRFDEGVLCPISLGNASGYLSYPVELLQPISLNDSHLSSQQTVACGFDVKLRPSFSPLEHAFFKEELKSRCMTGGGSGEFCPVLAADLHRFLSNGSLAALRSFMHALLDEASKQPIRLLVFGGSVPTGADAGGCCTRTSIAPGGCADNNFPQRYSRMCSWAYRLSLYLGEKLGSRFTYHEMSRPASDSSYAGAKIANNGVIIEGKPWKLSKGDLVILDASHNDIAYAAMNSGHTDLNSITKGVQMFLRAAMHTAHESTLPFLPAIVILEQWPFANSSWSAIPPSRGSALDDYSTAYRRLASHYGLPLWSLKDVAWRERAPGREYMGELLTYKRQTGLMTGPKIIEYYMGNHHPRWPVHLFLADLIAAYLLHTKPAAATTSEEAYSYTIPPPVDTGEVGGEAFCKVSLAAPYDADAAYTAPPIPRAARPCFELSDEGRSKPGWVSHLASPRDSSECSRSFAFNVPATVNATNMLLTVEYLRTFGPDAGMAQLRICNTTVAILDALWESPRHLVSLRITHTLHLRADVIRCSAVNEAATTSLAVSGKVRSISVEVEHVRGQDRLQERGRQKFKLLRLAMCSDKELPAGHQR